MKYCLLILTTLISLVGCRQTPREDKQWALPTGEWRFVYFTPYALDATVTHAAVVDTNNLLLKFYTVDPTSNSSDSIGKWYDRYSESSIHFNKGKYPPKFMMFCWDSLIDKRIYQTTILFSESLWVKMKTPAPWKSNSGRTVWYKTMLIGLAPEGKVRIWLQDVWNHPNVPVQPEHIETVSGDKATFCGNRRFYGDRFPLPEETKQLMKDKKYPYGEW